MTRVEKSDARESVLVVAEELFGEHGYRGVTLGDVAEALGMRKASLYYHFPGGKEELYVEVMYKMLERYRSEMEDAIEKASPGIRDQLRAAVESMLNQPPVSLEGLVRQDMPAISKERSERLMPVAFQALHGPLQRALLAAREREEIAFDIHLSHVSGTILSPVGGVRIATEVGHGGDQSAVAASLLDLLLDGLKPRPVTET